MRSFKWGGQWTDENGVKWSVVPIHSRVKFNPKSAGKHNKGTRKDSIPGLDKEGDPDDKKKMTLQMCVHRLRSKDKKDNENCGGIAKVSISRKYYKDFGNCVEKTWGFLSAGIDKGEAWEAHHNPGHAKCKAEVSLL